MTTSVSRGRPARKATPRSASRARPAVVTASPRSVSPAATKNRPSATQPIPEARTNFLTQAKAALNKPGRMQRVMESIESVQGAPKRPASTWPRWRKILLWVVMLMPVYAIIIYLVGAVYFLPAELSGVGLAKSLPVNTLKMVGNIAVPDVNTISDKNGVFLQTTTDPKQQLPMIMQFNDRSLQPPANQQFSIKASQLKYLLITQLQVSLPQDYLVYRVGQGADRPVTVHTVKVPVPGIAEMAISMPNGGAWQPGQYMLTLPQAGLDDETYYCFFTLQ